MTTYPYHILIANGSSSESYILLLYLFSFLSYGTVSLSLTLMTLTQMTTIGQLFQRMILFGFVLELVSSDTISGYKMSRFLKVQLWAFCLLIDASLSTRLLPLSAFESPGPISSPGLSSGLWNHGTKCLSSPSSWIPKALNSVSKTSHHLSLTAWSSYSVLCPMNASTSPLITKT